MPVPEAEPVEPPRERGWGRIILVLLALAVLPAIPLLRVVLPVVDPLVLIAPLMAALALAGWRQGGRGSLALLWGAMATWILWRATRGSTAFGELVAGWSVLLAVAFGIATSVASGPVPFLRRALPALGAALVVGGVIVAMVPGGWSGAIGLVGDEVGRRAVSATREWQAMAALPEWQELMQGSPAWEESSRTVERQLQQVPGPARQLFLAVLAWQGLIAMALSWAVYHRVATVRLGPPLAALRTLRFPDALVWGLIAGLALLALPVPGPLRTAGLDLTVFFGALYALRGVGVLWWFLAPGRGMSAVYLLLTLLFWPVVGAVTLTLGLGDTWFDWRRATRRESQRSE